MTTAQEWTWGEGLKEEWEALEGKDRWAIYVHTHEASGRAYVGLSIDPIKRWREHKCAARTGQIGCRYFNAMIRKYGPESFSSKVLDVCTTETQANAAEELWIKFLNSRAPIGLNLRSGGGPGRHSEETKAKMSAARIGKKLSPEHIAACVRGRALVPRKRYKPAIPCAVCGKDSTKESSTHARSSGGNAYCDEHIRRHGRYNWTHIICCICGDPATESSAKSHIYSGTNPYCEAHKGGLKPDPMPCCKCGGQADPKSEVKARGRNGNAYCRGCMRKPRTVKQI